MINERSAGAIVFIVEEYDQFKFLILHYTYGHWDFPKGNIEPGESDLEAARREIYEETHIQDIEFISNFRRKIKYYYRRENLLVKKEVVFFLAKTKTQKIILSDEHTGYVWKQYHEAVNQLTHKKAKRLLSEVHNILTEHLNN